MPFHAMEELTLSQMIHEVLSIQTLVALVVIGVGILLWFLRDKLEGVSNGLRSIRWAAENSFGFEAVNRAVVKITQNAADTLRQTQTGFLNWNVLGIVASLIILFAILVVGA